MIYYKLSIIGLLIFTSILLYKLIIKDAYIMALKESNRVIEQNYNTVLEAYAKVMREDWKSARQELARTPAHLELRSDSAISVAPSDGNERGR